MKVSELKMILNGVPDNATVVIGKWGSNGVTIIDEWDAGTMIEGSPGPTEYASIPSVDVSAANCFVLFPTDSIGGE